MISVSKVEKVCLNRIKYFTYIFQIISTVVFTFVFAIIRSRTGNDKASHYEYDSFTFSLITNFFQLLEKTYFILFILPIVPEKGKRFSFRSNSLLVGHEILSVVR